MSILYDWYWFHNVLEQDLDRYDRVNSGYTNSYCTPIDQGSETTGTMEFHVFREVN